MNLAWNKVWSERAHDFPGFAEDNIGAIRNDIANLCHRAGFDEVDDNDVQDLLESHAEPLSNDELIELDKASQKAEKEGDEEKEPVSCLDIKTLRECLGGIEKGLETLKERDPNPARSSKVAHDVEKSVKLYQEIYDKKTRKNKQSSIYSFFKPVRHAVPVTPADPATVGPSTSTADGSTAGPSSISSFFKPVKHADPATAGPCTYASYSADDDVLSSSTHSVEDEYGLKSLLSLSFRRDIV
ncbi:hypothetical protein E2C01_078172 [Portunus trituberculatus]|uniref:Tigger transposable element-derived protein 1 n=1 Tax=Portunus trituberculatus TaxID=210409 RepID=A0A5B7ID99_PORTR|nr:hypothetical protein [Portunus trituberculatus]